MLNEQQFYKFGQIETIQTGGQLYCDTFSHGECSLDLPIQENHLQSVRPKYNLLLETLYLNLPLSTNFT